MKTIICCIRHGQTDANKERIFQGQSNYPLNDTGRNQALTTGNMLNETNISFDVIITSPLKGAVETAEIIKKTLESNSPIIIDELAIERSFGDCEGLPITEENYQKILQNEFANEESEEAIIKRGQRFLEQLLIKYPHKNILVVSHSHFIKSLLIPFDESIMFNSSIRNASLNFLVFDNKQLTKMAYNILDTNDQFIIALK